MATNDHSSSGSPSVIGIGQADEYYEELDERTLDFRKRKASTPIPTVSLVKKASTPVDPIKQLNAQLNRKYRPDLLPLSPSSPLSPEPTVFFSPVKRILSPDPVIFDSCSKPKKSAKKPKERSVRIKQKLFNRIHRFTAPTTESTTSPAIEMPRQETTYDGYSVPPGMMLVPAPQEQSNATMNGSSQQPQSYPMVSQYKSPTVTYNNSFKTNKVAPPPSAAYNGQVGHQGYPTNSYRSPSSVISTNPLIHTYGSQQIPKYVDQSRTNKQTKKKQSDTNPTYTNDSNRSFALYNQNNGRIEGVVKNRLNVVADDKEEEDKITDHDPEAKGKWALWLSQPLCMGLTRLSGGILFGSMILLGAASISGLIASIALYSQDSTTDAQWKILGMVVCAIMLITIIVTLLIFICCSKHGYMFNEGDDDLDPTDPSATQNAKGNDRQKAVLRKIYKFNRPNDIPSSPSGMLQDVPTPVPMPQLMVPVTDKQTNTDTTIAPIRPRDFDRGVWTSINAFGGMQYRPLIPPQTVSRFIQVFPHEIEETFQPPPQISYQLVAPASAVPPSQVQPRIIQMPAQQGPVIEVVETTRKQPRTTIIRQPQTQQVVVQPTTRYEYVDVDEEEQQRPRRVIQQSEYVDIEEQRPLRVIQQPEYVDVEEEQPQHQRPRRIIQQPEYVDVEEQQRSRRVVQQPQYEIVEEVTERPSSSSEEYVEIVDAPKQVRHHGRKKGKNRNRGKKVSVKHVRTVDEF